MKSGWLRGMRLAALLSGGALSLGVGAAQAQVVVVAPGDTLVVPPDVNQVRLNDNSSLLVQPGGTVTNNAGDAVIDAVNGTTINVDNAGAIVSTADEGIDAGLSTLNLVNRDTGVITGIGDGVLATTIQSLVNSGSIAGGNLGINATTIQSLVNSGAITGGIDGVFAATLQSLVNSGAITGANDGIDANTIQSLVNSGAITGADDGILVGGTIQSLVNSGTITGDDDGIQVGGTIQSLVNSGLISGGAFAIRKLGAANTALTLLPGSVLIGQIGLGGGVNTLNVGNGLSIANTFVGGPPVVGNTFGAPFAVNGNQVAVVDPTNLAAQDEVLTDLTGGIFSTVHNRLNGFSGVSGVTANPRPSYAAGASSSHSALVENPYRQGWAQAFGSYRLQRGDGPAVDSDIRLGGVVSGLDGATGAGGRAGVFFGGSWGDVDADYDSQETDVESVFGGAYARWLKGSTFIDVAMTVGYSDYDRERRVANNLAPGGLETAQADYDGWFVSPEITFTRPLWQGERRFEKSVTLRYAGLFLDGFAEQGTAAPLTVDDRDIHVLQARTQLTMPNEREGADGSFRRDALYIGLEGRANVGDDDVSGALLAQNIVFDPGGDDAVAAAFAGLQFERTSASGTTLYASIEGQVETGGGRQASAKAGVRFRF